MVQASWDPSNMNNSKAQNHKATRPRPDHDRTTPDHFGPPRSGGPLALSKEFLWQLHLPFGVALDPVVPSFSNSFFSLTGSLLPWGQSGVLLKILVTLFDKFFGCCCCHEQCWRLLTLPISVCFLLISWRWSEFLQFVWRKLKSVCQNPSRNGWGKNLKWRCNHRQRNSFLQLLQKF